MLNGSLPPGQKEYKCRKNWFVGIRNKIDWLISIGILSQVPELIQKYRDYIQSDEFTDKERTTAEDIAFGNEVIDFLLENY